MKEKGIEELLRKYRLGRDELNNIRRAYPNINLFEKSLIGTEEIRQYIYCKRKIFFRYVLNSPMRQTYKMQYGLEKHEELQKLSNKSHEKTQKYFNIYLTDSEVGLVGVIDYFEYDGNEAYPIEIKSGNIPPEGMKNPDKYQVAAQALLIERNFDFLVKKVRVFYLKYEKFIEYPIGIEDKLNVLKVIKEIQEMIHSEKIPDPTSHKNKCRDCECNTYCLRA
ncbi:MAG: putative CRISPR-associated protein Cas4 [Promethearchaeota archaeon]|nr:MAG: putative CRISPR-associated protein Cas4 [Candidatus Lokiarchaeota archaeon]